MHNRINYINGLVYSLYALRYTASGNLGTIKKQAMQEIISISPHCGNLPRLAALCKSSRDGVAAASDFYEIEEIMIDLRTKIYNGVYGRISGDVIEAAENILQAEHPVQMLYIYGQMLQGRELPYQLLDLFADEEPLDEALYITPQEAGQIKPYDYTIDTQKLSGRDHAVIGEIKALQKRVSAGTAFGKIGPVVIKEYREIIDEAEKIPFVSQFPRETIQKHERQILGARNKTELEQATETYAGWLYDMLYTACAGNPGSPGSHGHNRTIYEPYSIQSALGELKDEAAELERLEEERRAASPELTAVWERRDAAEENPGGRECCEEEEGGFCR